MFPVYSFFLNTNEIILYETVNTLKKTMTRKAQFGVSYPIYCLQSFHILIIIVPIQKVNFRFAFVRIFARRRVLRRILCLKKNPPDSNFMTKLATFIVDKKTLFFLLYIFAVIFCAFSSGWVNVENDVTTYLPEDTETRQGIVAMNDNFTTFATAQIMVSNVTYETADELSQQIADVEGVSMVTFDDTPDHYTNASALFDISFDGIVSDEISERALSDVEALMDGYDYCVYSDVGYDENATLQGEMSVILIIAVVIIIVVLTLTSRSYAEVPVLMITFGVAAILNMGTNFQLGTISFISNSVAVVLQLALAIDYAIILCHRFTDERETRTARDACITALSKAIPEISASSLTTVSGLAALGFMEFKIGLDMALVLVKAILFSLLSVFTLMPGLLMLFSPLMRPHPPQKTTAKHHAYRQVCGEDPARCAAAVCHSSGRGIHPVATAAPLFTAITTLRPRI